jgi:hypothetical protein
VDYATKRFVEHIENCERLVAGLAATGPALAAAQEDAGALGRINDLFPDVLDAVATAVGRRPLAQLA